MMSSLVEFGCRKFLVVFHRSQKEIVFAHMRLPVGRISAVLSKVAVCLERKLAFRSNVDDGIFLHTVFSVLDGLGDHR